MTKEELLYARAEALIGAPFEELPHKELVTRYIERRDNGLLPHEEANADTELGRFEAALPPLFDVISSLENKEGVATPALVRAGIDSLVRRESLPTSAFVLRGMIRLELNKVLADNRHIICMPEDMLFLIDEVILPIVCDLFEEGSSRLSDEALKIAVERCRLPRYTVRDMLYYARLSRSWEQKVYTRGEDGLAFFVSDDFDRREISPGRLALRFKERARNLGGSYFPLEVVARRLWPEAPSVDHGRGLLELYEDLKSIGDVRAAQGMLWEGYRAFGFPILRED